MLVSIIGSLVSLLLYSLLVISLYMVLSLYMLVKYVDAIFTSILSNVIVSLFSSFVNYLLYLISIFNLFTAFTGLLCLSLIIYVTI